MQSIHVIIPVYNAKKYLQQAVDSVMEQPYKNIDIVLIDDGSIDESSLLCDRIAEQEDRVAVIHQENRGVSAARNTGIEYVLNNAKEDDYIAFVDADDLWVEKTITPSFMADIRGQAADIVGLSTYHSNPTAKRFYISNKYESCIIYKDKYNTKDMWPGGTFAAHLYRVSLFYNDALRFAEKSTHNEDIIFAVKAFFCAEKLMRTDKFLYIYRKNYTSVMNTTVYTPENATKIPDAWYEAKIFATMCMDISDGSRILWEKYCENVSAVRCLEFIRILAEQGYTYEAIQKCFENKNYFYNLDILDPDEFNTWQRQDLINYQKNKEVFCNSVVVSPTKRRLNQLKHIRIFSSIAERFIYKLSAKDIKNENN